MKTKTAPILVAESLRDIRDHATGRAGGHQSTQGFVQPWRMQIVARLVGADLRDLMRQVGGPVCGTHGRHIRCPARHQRVEGCQDLCRVFQHDGAVQTGIPQVLHRIRKGALAARPRCDLRAVAGRHVSVFRRPMGRTIRWDRTTPRSRTSRRNWTSPMGLTDRTHRTGPNCRSWSCRDPNRRGPNRPDPNHPDPNRHRIRPHRHRSHPHHRRSRLHHRRSHRPRHVPHQGASSQERHRQRRLPDPIAPEARGATPVSLSSVQTCFLSFPRMTPHHQAAMQTKRVSPGLYSPLTEKISAAVPLQ